MYAFGKRSLERLEGVHPDLVKVVKSAMLLQIMDMTIICGVRTDDEQKELYAQGRTREGQIVTWTLESKHKKQTDGYGHAVDIAPYPINWRDTLSFARMAGILQACARLEGVNIEWGGDWKNKDLPHLQLKKGI